jgi:colicin import membrane protein
MSIADHAEWSVLFSLSELAAIEESRVREETAHRASMQREQEAARQAAIDAEHAAERARIAAEQSRRAEEARADEEERVKRSAREQAELEVARIEAEARARLREEDAARAHELEVLRLRNDARCSRLRFALAGSLCAVAIGGATAGWAVQRHVAAIAQESQRVRDDSWALQKTHDETMAAELASLDARHASLAANVEDKATKALLRAEAARSAIETGRLDSGRLRSFRAALDELDGVAKRERQLATLDRRLNDLRRWAETAKSSAPIEAARKAAAKARDGGPEDVERYQRELDGLASALGSGTAAPVVAAAATAIATTKDTTETAAPRRCKRQGDPLCGFDGNALKR